MLAKTFTVLTLIVSLLFATQAQAFARPAETNCAAMKCVRGCCPDIACCRRSGQQGAPDTPAPAPRQDEVPIAAIGLRASTLLFTPPAPRRPFVILEDARAAHTLAPLALTCIRLI